ncbi:MAG: hypothetical protein A2350_11150 [Candidatus Raymondbacteria bacterium RifOxyB12_full_50_8]|nr:MAG: hypothetical protein A2350_11150 [Candidatus Raymondbacteria bacterium RifOxyB12_full_50_8]
MHWNEVRDLLNVEPNQMPLCDHLITTTYNAGSNISSKSKSFRWKHIDSFFERLVCPYCSTKLKILAALLMVLFFTALPHAADTVYFSEDFEDSVEVSAGFTINGWAQGNVAVTKKAAFRGTSGLRISADSDWVAARTLMLTGSSPELVKGLYCHFAMRLNRANGTLPAQTTASHLTLLGFRVVSKIDSPFTTPGLVLRKTADGTPGLLLLMRPNGKGRTWTIPDTGLALVRLSQWISIDIFIRVDGATIEDSLFIDGLPAGNRKIELSRPVGHYQYIEFRCKKTAREFGIASMDIDHFIISSARRVHEGLAMDIVRPRQDNHEFRRGDTVFLRLRLPPVSKKCYIDLNAHADIFTGDRGNRFGPFDETSNLTFSINSETQDLYFKYRRGSNEFIALKKDSLADRFFTSAIAVSMLDLSPGSGEILLPLVLNDKMVKGGWSFEGYLVRENGEVLDFPKTEFTIRDNSKARIFVGASVLAVAIALLGARAWRKRFRIVPDNWKSIVTEVDSFLSAHFHEELGSKSIARTVRLSPRRLLTIYQTVTGKSPMEQLREVRIEKACDMLRSSNDSITEISYKVGYSDPDIFLRNFKKMTGKSPSKYRTG